MRRLALVLAILTLAAHATAQEPRRVFAFRDWAVYEHTLASGARVCSTFVRRGAATFSIWADGARNYRLLWVHPGWQSGPTPDALEVQVDARPGWRVPGAVAEGDSISIWLPGGEPGMLFLRELAAGLRLTLRDGAGGERASVSLLGSTAALGALGACIDGLPPAPDEAV